MGRKIQYKVVDSRISRVRFFCWDLKGNVIYRWKYNSVGVNRIYALERARRKGELILLEKLWKRSTDITILKSYNVDSPWQNDAVLLHVNNGLGHLHMAYGIAKDNKPKSFMLLKDIPLVKLHSADENSCPTCEKLISAGYGLEKVNEETIDLIRSYMNQPYKTIDLSLDKLPPILKLLPNGYYAVADLPLYPSDGNGQFFWSQTNQPVINKGSCWIYYKQMVAEGTPTFILPSQLPERYDEVTIKKYREMYRAGEPLRGLAYYIGDYLCVLMDGHHKAVAAALEGCEFRCLTILPVNSISCPKDEEDFKMSIGGVWIDTKSLPPKINKEIKKTFGQANILKTDEVEEYLAMEAKCWDQFQWPKELLELGQRYPNAFTMACIEFAGDLSEERIRRLLHHEEANSEDKMDFILKGLIGLKDDRAQKFAMTIARDEGLCKLWQEAFEYIATIESEEVEDFFVDFLVNDEKMRPKLTKIADEYLTKRG